MLPKNEKPSAGILKPGSNEQGAPVGPDRVGAGLAELAGRLPDAGEGGPTAAAPAARRPLSELSRRVLARWGAVPLKALQVALGWGVDSGGTDAELLGECTLDLIGHSDLGVDPATEARARWAIAHGMALGEGMLAAWENKVDEKRKAAAESVKP